jgi:putative phage-type endonuclease
MINANPGKEILEKCHPQVLKLLKIPQYEQRSPEWFEQRKDKLTSSDVDTILKNNKYQKPIDVLFKKNGMALPFTGNVATRHGQKYEDEAIEIYRDKFEKETLSFGLLPHPTISWLGGSPDDITLDGIVIEVKCPLYRKIIMGEIPPHYIAQIKMNMEICNLDKAVFIEYKPISITNTGEIELNVVHFDRDPNWFPSIFETLKEFWDEVIHYRASGIETHEKYTYMKEKIRPKTELDFSSKKKKSKFVEDSDDEDKIEIEI